MAPNCEKKRSWGTGVVCLILAIAYMAAGAAVNLAPSNIYGSQVYFVAAAIHSLAAMASVMPNLPALNVYLLLCPVTCLLELIFGVNHATALVVYLTEREIGPVNFITVHCQELGKIVDANVESTCIALVVAVYTALKCLLWAKVKRHVSRLGEDEFCAKHHKGHKSEKLKKLEWDI